MQGHDRDGHEREVGRVFPGERETLIPMSELESGTVSEGEPDIRGWEVHTANGRRLGTVTDLLVDTKAGEVVLLDIHLPAADRHTFVGARLVEIDRARHVVTMDSADLPQADFARDAQSSARQPFTGITTVHYPRSDREVAITRSRASDIVSEGSGSPTEPVDHDRRRLEHRRIDRLSTGF